MRNGKGDKARPCNISQDELADNYNRAFKKGSYSEANKCCGGDGKNMGCKDCTKHDEGNNNE